jgi:hypothetical protein
MEKFKSGKVWMNFSYSTRNLKFKNDTNCHLKKPAVQRYVHTYECTSTYMYTCTHVHVHMYMYVCAHTVHSINTYQLVLAVVYSGPSLPTFNLPGTWYMYVPGRNLVANY